MTFLDLAKNRYSCRSYQPTPVEDEKLQYILESGRVAPSAKNQQPWHFIVIHDVEIRKKLFDVYPKDWYIQAPVHLIICGDKELSWKRKSDNMDALYIDIGITVDHMTLAATEQGLATCWICSFDAVLCKEILRLPTHIEPIVILPIGYPADIVDINRHSTKRKKLEEIIHWEKF